MWVPWEEADPGVWHYPGRQRMGYYGAVRLRDGKGVFRQEPAMFDGATLGDYLGFKAVGSVPRSVENHGDLRTVSLEAIERDCQRFWRRDIQLCQSHRCQTKRVAIGETESKVTALIIKFHPRRGAVWPIRVVAGWLNVDTIRISSTHHMKLHALFVIIRPTPIRMGIKSDESLARCGGTGGRCPTTAQRTRVAARVKCSLFIGFAVR